MKPKMKVSAPTASVGNIFSRFELETKQNHASCKPLTQQIHAQATPESGALSGNYSGSQARECITAPTSPAKTSSVVGKKVSKKPKPRLAGSAT